MVTNDVNNLRWGFDRLGRRPQKNFTCYMQKLLRYVRIRYTSFFVDWGLIRDITAVVFPGYGAICMSATGSNISISELVFNIIQLLRTPTYTIAPAVLL